MNENKLIIKSASVLTAIIMVTLIIDFLPW